MGAMLKRLICRWRGHRLAINANELLFTGVAHPVCERCQRAVEVTVYQPPWRIWKPTELSTVERSRVRIQ